MPDSDSLSVKMIELDGCASTREDTEGLSSHPRSDHETDEPIVGAKEAYIPLDSEEDEQDDNEGDEEEEEEKEEEGEEDSFEDESDDDDPVDDESNWDGKDRFSLPYNTKEDEWEESADLSISSLDISALFDCGREIGTTVSRILKPAEGLSHVVQGQLSGLSIEAKGLEKFEPKSEVKLALLGNHGEGKSSLANSIQNAEQVAITGDLGASVTSVPTEFRKRRKDDTALVTIEVDHLTQGEVETKISKCAQDYRRPYLPENKDMDNNDCMKEMAREAFDILSALFKDQARFSSDFLLDMSADGEGKVLDELSSWIEEIDWPVGWDKDGRVWRASANTPGKYRATMQQLSISGLWVFANVIRVYRDATVLSNGTVLVDLPGLQDANVARVKKTEKYIFGCQVLFVVAAIGRSISSETVKDTLSDGISKTMTLSLDRVAKYIDVGIVCTKTHELQPLEILEELYPKKLTKSSKQNTNARKPNFKELSAVDKLITRERPASNKLRKELKAAGEAGDETRIEAVEQQLKDFCIKLRCQHVKAKLEESYAEAVPGSLHVFMVDNKEYKIAASKGDRAIDAVHASGIPAVRLFCRNVSMDAQVAELRSFLAGLDQVVNSIQLWHDPTKHSGAHGSFELRLREANKLIGTKVSQHRDDIIKNVDNGLTKWLTDDVLEMSFSKGCTAAEQWASGFVHSQYSAWIRNNGIHKTRGGGFQNWMARFGEALRKDLQPAAELLMGDVAKTQDVLYEEVSMVLQDLLSSAVHLALPKELSDNISLRIGTAKRDFIRRKLKLIRDLELLQMKAIEGAEGGYIQDEWKKTFHEARQAKGVGKFMAQKNKVKAKLTEGIEIYRSIGNRYKKDKLNLTYRGFEDHLKEFGHIINQIQADLDRCTVKEDVKIEPELDEYRLHIAKELEPIKKQIELLSKKLPDEAVKVKGPVKRKAAAKSDGTGAKKPKMKVGAGSEKLARAQ